MKRPAISGQALAAIVEATARRLLKKVDANPQLAEAWQWNEGGVVTDSGETVTVVGPVVAAPDAITCTCLLSPRCLHVVAVAHVLPLADAVSTDAGGDNQEITVASPHVAEATREAAARLCETLAAFMAVGARGAGASLQARLLRAAHAAKVASFTNGDRLTTALVRMLRQYHARHGVLDRQHLLQVTLDLALCAAGVRRGDAAAVGKSRRKYEHVGSLNLDGLFCEPVATGSGYAGVATHFRDRNGQRYTLSNVLPGDKSRASGAYLAGASIGDVAQTPSVLCRAGLLLQNAKTSAEGRLSRGKDVRAVVRETQGAWPQQPLREAATNALSSGDSLCFGVATVAGYSPRGQLVLSSDDKLIVCDAATADNDLPFVANLAQLARKVDARFVWAARVRQAVNPTVVPLAIRDIDKVLSLPQAWRGVVNLGLDELAAKQIGKSVTRDVALAPPPANPLARIDGWLVRVALMGRAVLLGQDCLRTSETLSSLQMPAGAARLAALHQMAVGGRDPLTGTTRFDDTALLDAWVAAGLYARAATAKLLASVWR